MIAPNTVIPPFSLVAGRPGVVVEELPETTPEMLDCKFWIVGSRGWKGCVLMSGYSEGGLQANIIEMMSDTLIQVMCLLLFSRIREIIICDIWESLG